MNTTILLIIVFAIINIIGLFKETDNTGKNQSDKPEPVWPAVIMVLIIVAIVILVLTNFGLEFK